ncbi:Uncharacterised protein [Serratia plymuthica]|nr:Uncharacterised protein [Serratia plymuthica]
MPLSHRMENINGNTLVLEKAQDIASWRLEEYRNTDTYYLLAEGNIDAEYCLTAYENHSHWQPVALELRLDGEREQCGTRRTTCRPVFLITRLLPSTVRLRSSYGVLLTATALGWTINPILFRTGMHVLLSSAKLCHLDKRAPLRKSRVAERSHAPVGLFSLPLPFPPAQPCVFCHDFAC